MKIKGIAAWLALLLGSLGLHRLYLYGLGDRWAWAHPLPTLLALIALRDIENIDAPQLTWALPLFGLMVAIGCLNAILIGLMPDERWNARHNPQQPATASRWAPVLAAVFALLLGGTALMASISFSAQRYFEISLGQ
jgi:hypothetical protein